jgi:hypothetical protein
MAKLNTHVYLLDNGETKGFGPDDELPEHIARQIGAHAFEGGVHPFAGKDDDGDGQNGREPGVEPPRTGKGSTRDAWVAFATETGHGDLVQGTSGRDELIQALADVGQIQA